MTLPWPFEREYMQLALAAGLVVGATAPLIGAFVVQRRLSLIGDGIGHVAFAGVAAGTLLHARPVWTALVGAVAGALLMDEFRRRTGGRSGDTALALIFYTGIAAGVVMFSAGGKLDASVFSYLFGSILTVDRAELITVAALGATILVVVAITRRALFAVVTDDEWSRVAGIPAPMLDRLLVVLAAVTVVAAMRVVGVLLVAALMVLPVAAVRPFSSSFARTMRRAVAVGIVSVVAGLALARAIGTPAGATIVLCCAALTVAGTIAGARR